MFGIVGFRFWAGRNDRLIRGQVHGFIDGPRTDPARLEIRFGPNDEERLALMKSEETPEIEITAVKDIKAAGLRNEIVQNPHVVRFSICDLDKRGDPDRRSVSLCNGRDSGPRIFGIREAARNP
jgi:hypothetical protein